MKLCLQVTELSSFSRDRVCRSCLVTRQSPYDSSWGGFSHHGQGEGEDKVRLMVEERGRNEVHGGGKDDMMSMPWMVNIGGEDDLPEPVLPWRYSPSLVPVAG